MKVKIRLYCSDCAETEERESYIYDLLQLRLYRALDPLILGTKFGPIPMPKSMFFPI